MSRPQTSPRKRLVRSGAFALAAVSLAVAGLQYAPTAQARGYHGHRHHHHGFGRGGALLGGIVIGAAIARPYYDSYYYRSYSPPPVYYTPPAAYYPPQYYAPPATITYIEQQPQPQVVPAPQNYVTAPQAAAPQLPLEQRAQRLKAMCDQGLFTAQECAVRREQILREM